LVQALRKKRPYLAANLDQVILHQDNALAHTSHTTQLELDLLGFECLKHPPYSPDLAPMDFAVFPYIKSFLLETHTRSMEKIPDVQQRQQ
jgi:histone-lysine N-methyltransferase SETMAR